MIGLEYILSLYNIPHVSLAEELGIKRQNINLWIKGKGKIPKKYLPILSNKFKIPEEYFQKELDDIDKLQIQKIKLNNEITFIEEVQMYDPEEINEIYKLDIEIEKNKLIAKIYESFEKSNMDKSDMIWAYNRLAILFASNKIKDEMLIKEVLSALTTYYGIGHAFGRTVAPLIKLFKKREERMKNRNQ